MIFDSFIFFSLDQRRLHVFSRNSNKQIDLFRIDNAIENGKSKERQSVKFNMLE